MKKDIIKMLVQFYNVYAAIEQPWKSRAYKKALSSLKNFDGVVPETEQGWIKLPGIGSGIAKKIIEFQETGKVKKLITLQKEVPPESVLCFTDIPGVGIKKAKEIFTRYKCKTLEALFSKLGKGNIKEEWLVRGMEILRARGDQKHIPLYKALQILDENVPKIKRLKFIKEVIPVGSVRRFKPMVKDLDTLAVVSNSMDVSLAVKKISKRFNLDNSGKAKCYIPVGEGRFIDLHVCKENNLGSMLLYATGSGEWNQWLRTLCKNKDWKLNRYGLTIDGKLNKFKSEKKLITKILGTWVPPECRERPADVGKGNLVTLKDIKGDFHIHSSKSDGELRPKEIASTCSSFKYKFFGLGDHVGPWSVRDISEESLIKWIKVFNANKSKLPIKGLIGGEVDITKKGKLSIDPKVINKLDFVILSSHLSPGQDIEIRYITAINKIKSFTGIKILAHPINRNFVKGSMLEWDEIKWTAIFKYCKDNDIYLEINGTYERLDLDWTLVRTAKTIGCKFVLSSDAHSKDALYGNMVNAVMVARKGNLTPNEILNCTFK